ncbi:hypothetical protein CDAR_391441 [Caerostris darwini]|uniref:Uncharacterized protein n=1 Tax=Caerostris darwini TaxID=1538125 RepID=A0AAV4W7U8_9ARAC|nr:hypothetical protein CDAR_391441 [Caerostris darwini]
MSQSCMKCSHQEKPVEDSVIHKDRMARSRCIDGLLVEGFIPQEAEVGNFLQLSISNSYILPLKFRVPLAPPPYIPKNIVESCLRKMSQSCMKCSHQEKPVEDSVIHKDRMARSGCIDGLLVKASFLRKWVELCPDVIAH